MTQVQWLGSLTGTITLRVKDGILDQTEGGLEASVSTRSVKTSMRFTKSELVMCLSVRGVLRHAVMIFVPCNIDLQEAWGSKVIN